MKRSGMAVASDGRSPPGRPGRSPSQAPPERLTMLTVGNSHLDQLAIDFALAHPGARSFHRGQANVVDFVSGTAVDLIFLDVDASMMAGFILAAHIRAVERGRGRDSIGNTVIVATTSSDCKFRDCLVSGNALDGALKMPCNARMFAACVERWRPADGLRAPEHPQRGLDVPA